MQRQMPATPKKTKNFFACIQTDGACVVKRSRAFFTPTLEPTMYTHAAVFSGLTVFATWARRAVLVAIAALPVAVPLALPVAAQASVVSYFVPFEGAGNVSVFDATAGTGGWVGSIDPTPDALAQPPFPGVSTVLFSFDAISKVLTGTFEISSGDLLSTLFGSLVGTTTDADWLGAGGQMSLDYTVLGGTGAFDGARGFGLSFVNYDPSGGFNNYGETGLLNFTVPSPSTASLVLAALLATALLRARRPSQPVPL
jgi:hypothetical protein